jgi:demethylmenaquinone methyltransferase/2-methoxy-6-polyprenyl-1,4-benzoquinol methylase
MRVSYYMESVAEPAMIEKNHGRKIQTMFNRISPRYDFLNRLLSGGHDMRWRKQAADLLGDLRHKRALDLCCGSGDFLSIFRRRYGEEINLYGVDFASQMLGLAANRLDRDGQAPLLLCQADALALPFTSGSLDAVTIGFGIRNIQDKPSALREITRVLAPNGRLAIIEPAVPRQALARSLFGFYFKRVMPLVGGAISGDYDAYKYLNDSVVAFPEPDEFLELMKEAGLIDTRAVPRLFGVAMIYYGRKPA